MKAKNYKKGKFSILTKMLLVMVTTLLFANCQDDVVKWEPKSSSMVITEYVINNPDKFSEFNDILIATGADNLLRVRGPFTLLLPTNDALKAYYAKKNTSSYTEIDTEQLKDLVYNHIVKGEISAGLIGLGALQNENALGDFIATDLPGSDILLNKTAKIIKRDIKVSNGYIHHIDAVLDVITESVYDVLKSDPGYSIFTAGLAKSGLSDTLDIVEFAYGNTTARNRYTILAVPDTLYNRDGVNSIDDLVSKYSNSDNLKDKENGFYQYMEYHCLSGTNYFSDFSQNGIYYLISYNNYLSIKVEEDWKINKTDSSYTGFYTDQSNIPAKNGVIHTVNTELPNEEAAPAEIIWQVTDYFDFQQGSYYGNNYERFYDGQNTFEYIKWDAEYLLYYFKNEDKFLDADGLSLNGHFWIEVTTPKIRAGKYQLDSYWFGGAVVAFYVDGEYMGQFKIGDTTWNDYLPINTVEFAETEQHVIRIETVQAGNVFWDRLRFTPL